MKNYLLRFKQVSKGKYFIYILLSLIFIYHLVGIFPITRFETDSMAIANACEEMIQSGHFEDNVLGHSYHMQSGTYFLIVALAKTFGLSTFISYSVITIIFAFIYWIFLVLILKKFTNANLVLIIIILFLFQEIFILSYYANSAVIASTFWIISFYLLWISDRKYIFILAALLLALAAWFRVDVAFTFPSVLLLLYMKNRNLKSAILKSVLIAIIVVPVTLLFMYLMNANVEGFLGYTEYHGELFGSGHNMGILDLYVVKAHAAYFSILLLFLIVISIIFLFKKKNFIPIIFLISGILFYYLLGINNAIAPKHLSYYTLFWSALILFGLNYFNQFKPLTKKLLISIGIFLFIIQYIIGTRIDISSIPYQFEKYSTVNPEPTLFSIGSINLNKSSVQNINFVFGAGTKISTPDELSASSGILFSPIMWFKQKDVMYDTFNRLNYVLNNSSDDTLFLNVTNGSSQLVINNLLTNCFIWKEKKIDFNSDFQQLTFVKTGSPIIKLTRYDVNKSNFEEYLRSFNNEKDRNYFLVFIWDWQNYAINKLRLPYFQTISHQIHRLNDIK